MSEKKFINKLEDVVSEAIEGHCRLHPEQLHISGTGVVALRDIDPSRVHLICGGGSGHEPAHIGFIGKGWLSAAVCGPVYASPPTSHVTTALDYLNSKGVSNVLVVIKNYTGDVLNFGCAVKLAKARGMNVESVIVGDDCTFGVEDTNSARRGIAGTVLLYKILGAAAERGDTLQNLKLMGDMLRQEIRSMGASLSSCVVPGSSAGAGGSLTAHGNHEMELGLGIHGEKGGSRVAVLSADETVEHLLNKILNESGEIWKAGTPVAVLINNLGATSGLEQSILVCSVLRSLEKRGMEVTWTCEGRYMTSIDMHGFSITLVRCSASHEILRCLESPSVPLLTHQCTKPVMKAEDTQYSQLSSLSLLPLLSEKGTTSAVSTSSSSSQENTADISRKLTKVLCFVFTELKKKAKVYNELDAAVGDGDMGQGVDRACTAALEALQTYRFQLDKESFLFLGAIIADSFAGTSGPLYGAFFSGAAAVLKSSIVVAVDEEKSIAAQLNFDKGAYLISQAFCSGAQAVSELGGAMAGERTMYDVLHAVKEVCLCYGQKDEKEGGSDTPTISLQDFLDKAESTARLAATAVREMRATKGRSRYLAGKEIGMPDPGAELVADWVSLVAQGVRKSE